MGMDEIAHAKRDRRQAAKIAKPERRVQRIEDRGADWEECDAALLQRCVTRVAAQGGALRLGYTRDGGAFAIGIYGDGDQPYTEYVRPSEDIDSYLRALAEQWDDGK